MFIAANYEDKNSSVGGSAGQFMRHEFIEGCVRVACLVAREELARRTAVGARCKLNSSVIPLD